MGNPEGSSGHLGVPGYGAARPASIVAYADPLGWDRLGIRREPAALIQVGQDVASVRVESAGGAVPHPPDIR